MTDVVVTDSRPWLRRTVTGDVLAILRTTGRAFTGHWPVLLSLCMVGLGARQLLTEAAVKVSHASPEVGLLVFILAPVAMLVTLILMLRSVRPALPYVSTLGAASGTSDWRRTLDAVGAVTLPFLTVYVASGYLEADKSTYYYSVFMSNPLKAPALPTRLTVTAIVVVVVAAAARTILGRWPAAQRAKWLGIPRAYLEVVWMATLALLVTPLVSDVWAWVGDRRAAHWGIALEDSTPAWIHAILGWFGSALGSADSIIALPVAWLVVAAVVYGQDLEPEAKPNMKVARKLVRAPSIVRLAFGKVQEEFDDRFGEFVTGVRVLIRAGLISALVFCLLFVISQTVGTWLFELERSLFGPQDFFTFWYPMAEPMGLLSIINDAVVLVLLVCLLSASADRVLWSQATSNLSRPRIPAPRESTNPVSPVQPGTAEQPIPDPALIREPALTPEPVLAPILPDWDLPTTEVISPVSAAD